MIAILNYYDDPRISEQQKVTIGSLVKSITDDFDIVKDKLYEVVEVNAIDMISIKNELGIIQIYSVEWFNPINWSI